MKRLTILLLIALATLLAGGHDGGFNAEAAVPVSEPQRGFHLICHPAIGHKQRPGVVIVHSTYMPRGWEQRAKRWGWGWWTDRVATA